MFFLDNFLLLCQSAKSILMVEGSESTCNGKFIEKTCGLWAQLTSTNIQLHKDRNERIPRMNNFYAASLNWINFVGNWKFSCRISRDFCYAAFNLLWLPDVTFFTFCALWSNLLNNNSYENLEWRIWRKNLPFENSTYPDKYPNCTIKRILRQYGVHETKFNLLREP